VSALVEGPFAATVARETVVGIDGATVDVVHAVPTGTTPTSGVVVHPDLMGIRPLFDDLCRRLATHGVAVASPEPFARASREVRESEDPSTRMALIPTFDDAVQLGDLARAADLLGERDGAATVSVIGFCMGGLQTLKAAAAGRFAKAVAFYGMIRLPDSWQGPHFADGLARAADVCPTLGIFGGADPWTPASDIEALRVAWHERPECEIVVYPEADHGFVHAPERPAHRADDAADAWARTLAWLGLS
jgi:carboxymethylenebutenolidase